MQMMKLLRKWREPCHEQTPHATNAVSILMHSTYIAPLDQDYDLFRQSAHEDEKS